MGITNSGNDPLLSIITPFYNAGACFEQTFCSVMNQTFPWFEWIIVDDGSTDEKSLEILEQQAGKDKRIRTVHQENGGISSARNTGIRNSSTEIIVPLDADDLIEPVFLEELYFALKTNPDAAWAYTDVVGFGDQEYLWRQHFSSARMKKENLLVPTSAIRKQWLLKVGGYQESRSPFYEDWHLWLRMLAEGAHPVHVRGYHSWYRRGTSGVLYRILQDQALKEDAQRIIEEAAANVKEIIPAKEYPVNTLKEPFRLPEMSLCDRKVFQLHNKTHVLLLLSDMVMGGADRFNLDVCSRIDRGRFELGIITTDFSENDWQQRFAEYVADIFHLPDFLDKEDWAEFISYYIKSREVDVLFLSNSYFGYYLLPWLRKEFPDIVIMDYVHVEEWHWGAGGMARASGAMDLILEKTLVCNEKTRDVMIRHFSRVSENVETLYIGTDPEVYDPCKVEAGRAKKQMGIDETRPVILFPCRFHFQKRPFLMLEIAKSLRNKMPEAAFVAVGDGPLMEEMQKTADRDSLTNTVYFAGRQDDMLPWYKDASLTLICSIKEGVALTAYESLAMGVPVISSDVGGQPELIDRTVGRVVPMMQDEAGDYFGRDYLPEEVIQYVDAIISALSDQSTYEKMCVAARQRIEENFSLEHMISRLEEIFEEMSKNENFREKRRDTAQVLKRTGKCVDESVSVYLRWKNEEGDAVRTHQELEEQHKELEEQYQELGKCRQELEEYRQKLKSIREMRSWKLVEKYCNFMDHTVAGRLLGRIRDMLRR